MKKILNCIYLILFFMLMSNIAFATTMYNDRALWELAVDSFIETTDYPGEPFDTLAADTAFDIGYGTNLSFSIDLSVREIGSGWLTWSGGYTGEVLSSSIDSFVGTFTSGLRSFGFEAEPNNFSEFDITLELNDGSTLSQSVVGDSGADFFGFVSDIDIQSFTISADPTAEGFAIGRFVSGPAVHESAVPEPSTSILFGLGLLGFFGIIRKQS